MVFPYTPVGWTEGESSLGPANLGHMDAAIKTAYDAIPSAVNRARISGLALGSTGADFLLWDAQTVYIRAGNTFGRLNLAIGQYTALAAPGYSGSGSLLRLDADHILSVVTSSSTAVAVAIYSISGNSWAAGTSKAGLVGAVVKGTINPLDAKLYAVIKDTNVATSCFVYDPVAKTWGAALGTVSTAGSTPYDMAFDDQGYLYFLMFTGTRDTDQLRTNNPLPAGPFAVNGNQGRWYDYEGDPQRMFVHDGFVYSMQHWVSVDNANRRLPDYTEVNQAATGRRALLRGPDIAPSVIDFDNGVAWLLRIVDTATIDTISSSFATGVIL